jgi:glutaredoxin
LKAWSDSLGGIHYPLLSDFWPHGKIAETYGVLRQHEGRSERAIFVIDKQGIVQYIDIHDIDLQPDNEELRNMLRKIDPAAAAREVRRPESALPQGGIVMYCTKWCADCKVARDWFLAHKLPYTEVDIYSVEGALKQCMAWNDGILVTPVFNIDGTILVDYDEAKLTEILQDRL